MASIVLRQFGGMAPSANAKAIPEGQATYARNLNLRFGDFRPLPVPATVTTATAGDTLYKFTGAETFITKPGDVSFVRGPIPNDATERTYYTGDGAPKVTDLTLAIRQLGVPAPTAAPTVTVNAVAQYSTDDAAAAQAHLLTLTTQLVRSNFNEHYDGIPITNMAPLIGSPRPWEFSFVVVGSVDGNDVFTPTNPSNNNLLDGRFYFYRDAIGGVPVVKVPLFAQGKIYSFDTSLKDALLAMTDPSDLTNSKPLLTSEQCDNIVTALNDYIAPAQAQLADSTAKLTKFRDDFVLVADSAQTLIDADSVLMSQFYASASVASAITAAKNAAITAIVDAMQTFDTAVYSGD
jgi:hypothetical protein